MADRSKKLMPTDFSKKNAQMWRQALDALIPKLYRMFMNKWPNQSLAEELVQKTVFDAVKGSNSFDSEKGNVEQWVFAIGKNNLALEMRTRAARPTVNGDITGYLKTIDSRPLPDEVLEKNETAHLVRRALDQLDEKEKNALVAKYLEGASAKQIAEKTGTTEKAVHSLLYRARINLRDKLKSLAPEIKQGNKK